MGALGSSLFEVIRESLPGAFEVKTLTPRKPVCHGQWAQVRSGNSENRGRHWGSWAYWSRGSQQKDVEGQKKDGFSSSAGRNQC